jgi:hypothetical protein
LAKPLEDSAHLAWSSIFYSADKRRYEFLALCQEGLFFIVQTVIALHFFTIVFHSNSPCVGHGPLLSFKGFRQKPFDCQNAGTDIPWHLGHVNAKAAVV